MEEAFCQMFWQLRFTPEDVVFKLDLRRASVFTDTFEQLAAARHSDFKRPLLVNYSLDLS